MSEPMGTHTFLEWDFFKLIWDILIIQRLDGERDGICIQLASLFRG